MNAQQITLVVGKEPNSPLGIKVRQSNSRGGRRLLACAVCVLYLETLTIQAEQDVLYTAAYGIVGRRDRSAVPFCGFVIPPRLWIPCSHQTHRSRIVRKAVLSVNGVLSAYSALIFVAAAGGQRNFDYRSYGWS